MTPRMNENLMKVLFFIVIFIMMLLQSVFTSAQTSSPTLYKGFDVCFGTRLFTINSNIDDLHLSETVQNGGRIGVVYGNEILRTTLGAGYYSSTGSTPGTVDQYEAGAVINFYPLSWFLEKSPRIEPYFTGGIAYTNFQFYGYYITREPGQTNYSQGEAPHLGSIRQLNTSFGAGLQVRILDHDDFVHFYSEIRYGNNLPANSTEVAFDNTTIKNQIQVNVGLSFGLHK